MFLSGLKWRQVDSEKLPPIRCDLRPSKYVTPGLQYNSKEATSGVKSVVLNRDLMVAQLDAAIQNIRLFALCVCGKAIQ